MDHGLTKHSIKRDPLELIRHAESEFWAWFDANSKTSDETQPRNHGLTKHITVDMVGCGRMDQEMNNS
uniref:Uncharacterized protein n=1 Tax=Brassica oleracea TaxID=3712 RepID=A0A3P6BM34_BRAOL|nr:unnamed protein product [Brassica oleracea]